MLDLIGSVVGLAAVGVDLVALTQFLPGSLARRLWIGGLAGGWVGFASYLGATGRLTFASEQPVPLVAVLCALPLLSVGLIALTSARARAALLAIPQPILIGVNSLRVLGVLFLLLALAGRLSGPFPYFAGFGDIITGLIALPLALGSARSGQISSAAIWRWNVFGALDLIVAITLGLTSANGSPLHLLHAGVGSQAVQFLPYCLIPTVLVPFYLITHGIIAAQLRAPRAAGALSWV
jgi:hypothetical protein